VTRFHEVTKLTGEMPIPQELRKRITASLKRQEES